MLGTGSKVLKSSNQFTAREDSIYVSEHSLNLFLLHARRLSSLVTHPPLPRDDDLLVGGCQAVSSIDILACVMFCQFGSRCSIVSKDWSLFILLHVVASGITVSFRDLVEKWWKTSAGGLYTPSSCAPRQSNACNIFAMIINLLVNLCNKEEAARKYND